jgi:hypothetical protein
MMLFPDTVQERSEDESEKKYGLLAENEHEPLTVTFSVAVTVTQVPGGPVDGNRLTVVNLKSPVVALTGAGDTTDETKTNSAEVSSSTINREPELRLVKLRHAVLISWVRIN